MHYLSLNDLFLVGLALDVTGATLLARGLLISPKEISAVSATLWGGNRQTSEDRASSRVYAEFGVGYLALGFVLQAVGYCLEISGSQVATGSDRLIAALAMAVIASGLALLIYRVGSRPRLASLLSGVIAEDERRKAEGEKRQEEELKRRKAKAAKGDD